MSKEYTADQKRKIVVAYMASGNSAEALIEQLLEQLYGKEQPFVDQFAEIQHEIEQARREEPEMETTADEELQTLEQMYNEHLAYSYNSPILG